MSFYPGSRRGFIRATAIVFFTTHAFSLSAQGVASKDEERALDAVRRLRLGRNLSTLAFQAASRTQTYAFAVAELGETRARTLLVQYIQQVAPRYQERWDLNLARSHLERLTAAELVSIAEQGPNSPSAPKLQAEQNAIGTAMQARSSRLLTEMVADILSKLFQDLPKR